jgi:hypothetical protein
MKGNIMKIVGIDPGKAGCIVELDLEERLCRFMFMPWREDGLLCHNTILDNIDLGEAHYIGIEKNNAMPSFGTKNFPWGWNVSACFHLLVNYPYDSFAPGAWQKKIHGVRYCKKSTVEAKARTASAFKKMNPNFEYKHMNAANKAAVYDAFCIAYYTGLKNNVVMPNNFRFDWIDGEY